MDHNEEKSDFAVPLNLAKSGHLVFPSETAGVTILTDPSISELARGSFEHDLPRLRVEEDMVANQGRKLLLLSHSIPWPGQSGEIMLNPSVPWEIEFRCGLSNLNADLQGLALRSLDLLGGASQISLLLPKPADTTFIYITGGIDNALIRVPSSVGIRVQISGGVSRLLFDNQHFDAIDRGTVMQNAAFKSVNSRYDIYIAGGADHLTITQGDSNRTG